MLLLFPSSWECRGLHPPPKESHQEGEEGRQIPPKLLREDSCGDTRQDPGCLPAPELSGLVP